jgi:hypothetical protein
MGPFSFLHCYIPCLLQLVCNFFQTAVELPFDFGWCGLLSSTRIAITVLLAKKPSKREGKALIMGRGTDVFKKNRTVVMMCRLPDWKMEWHS